MLLIQARPKTKIITFIQITINISESGPNSFIEFFFLFKAHKTGAIIFGNKVKR